MSLECSELEGELSTVKVGLLLIIFDERGMMCSGKNGSVNFSFLGS